VVDDAKAQDYWVRTTEAYFDPPKLAAIMKESSMYYLQQVWYILLPSTYQYSFWQPWLKSYGGEYQMGYANLWCAYPRYVWLDLNLKEKMTGRR